MTEIWQLSTSTPPEGCIIPSEKSQMNISEGKIISNPLEYFVRKDIDVASFSTMFS